MMSLFKKEWTIQFVLNEKHLQCLFVNAQQIGISKNLNISL